MNIGTKELVSLCLKGNEDAWKQFVEEYRDLVYSICLSKSASPHDAEDLMQDVFLKIWANLGSYDPARGTLVAWISTVTRNAGLDKFRRNWRDRMTESIDETSDESGVIVFGHVIDSSPTPHDLAASCETTEIVLRQGKKIPPEMWEIVRMKFLHELDNREIAQRLRIPEGTVKSRISRGRARLASVLSPLNVALGAA
jgi:RNA polymerase sigma-70 factor, ECF subfamily